MSDLEELAELVAAGDVLAITGAGMSTDCGLPDYRGSGGGEAPSVDYDSFVYEPMWQRWVWQRNQETWQTLDSLTPSPAHMILAEWERRGLLTGIATQNIDGLHSKAGSRRVAEMHGSFRQVRCIDCDEVTPRSELDPRLRALNPDLAYDANPANAAILATADRQRAEASTFNLAPCATCGGVLKPDIVFFGESVQAIPEAFEMAREAKTTLVLGTSLLVLTGMWVLQEAWSNGSQLAIINRGPTQADRFADIRIEGGVSETLTAINSLLLS